eukprot:911346_1
MLYFLAHSIRWHNTIVQIFSDIYIALNDRIEAQLVDGFLFLADQIGFELEFWPAESLSTDRNHLSIGQFIILFKVSRGFRLLHFIVQIQCDVGQFLLQITHNLRPGRWVERISIYMRVCVCSSLHSLSSQSCSFVAPVISRPATSNRNSAITACGKQYPSKMGTVWLHPSLESKTMAVVRHLMGRPIPNSRVLPARRRRNSLYIKCNDYLV